MVKDGQGSILGPLFFRLFIRNLLNDLRHSSCRIYADDTQIYHHFYASDINDAIAKVEMDAQAVADWACANGLELNESKTKIMLMGSLPYVVSIDMSSLPKVVINGTRILSLHVSKIHAKVYGSLKFLSFHRRSLSFEMKKQLLQTLVMPHFDYTNTGNNVYNEYRWILPISLLYRLVL